MVLTNYIRAISLLGLCGAVVFSQQSAADKGQAFEVASIKVSAPPSGRGGKGSAGSGDPSLFSVRNSPLKRLIRIAYDLADYQIAGGPAWIDTDLYDVDAKPATPTPRTQMMPMLRALLAERFQLRTHHETRPIASYVLQVAKGGPKYGPQFHRLADGVNPADGRDADPKLGMSLGGDMKGFAFLLGLNMRNFRPDGDFGVQARDVPPVVDQTGLPGTYDIFLRTEGPNSDLVALVEEQLGLKLELKKVPTDILVIDSATKPAGN